VKRSRLKSRSSKRAEVYVHRRAAIEAMVADGVGCLICPVLVEAGVPTERCAGIQGLHERRKRSAGGSLLNPQNLIPACNWSNGWIEDNPAAARELFGSALVVREGDSEFESLGRRSDP